MNTRDAVGQKIKGKAKKIQGELNMRRGKTLKGVGQKIEGEIRDSIGSAALRVRTHRSM